MSKITESFDNIKDSRLAYGSAISWAMQVFVGSLFLALMAQISIPLPFSLVPLSFQAFGVAVLAITLGSKKAPWAVAAYLVEATMGFPVLAGGAINPAWMIGPKAGYLIGFFCAAYLIAKLLESVKNPTLIKSWLCVIAGEALILGFGWIWLSYFVGFGVAFLTGVVPFIPGALIKTFAAANIVRPVEWIKNKISQS